MTMIPERLAAGSADAVPSMGVFGASAQSGLEIGFPVAKARGSNNPAPRSRIEHGMQILR
jgi:hypothetical protein